MADYLFRLTIEGPEHKSQVFDIPVGITTVGRQPGSELTLPSNQVSRAHARLEAVADECHLADLGSSNGTYLNGEKLTANVPMRLTHGDKIKIGPFEMAFEQIEIRAVTEFEEPGEAEAPAHDPSLVEEVAPPPPEPPPKKEKPAKKPKAAPPPEPEAAAPTPEPEAAKPPTPPAPPPPPARAPAPVNGSGFVPPGMTLESRKLIRYLPGIYHTDFMKRFLGIFESILSPVEWTIDNFDLFLDPAETPEGFLPWLAGWYGVTFNATWSEAQRRTLLKEAHQIYGRRGTRWALSRVLEIYTGHAPEIDDLGKDLDPFTFTVTLPVRKAEVEAELIEAIIDAHKPAHTSYKVRYRR